MTESFEEFMKLCRKSVELDPWANKRDVEGYCNEIKIEAQEVIDAVNNNDIENLREELGDVLLDWLHACLMAEKAGHFTTDEVIDEVKEKLARRKPFLGENKTVSLDEARELWQKAKKLEKDLKKS